MTGANGAGKTTLIRALAGLTTPFAGEVRREGPLALLDERTGLDPDLPLGKALAFWSGDRPACHVTGANGAGKTTLIRALAGLTTPFAGEVRRGIENARPSLVVNPLTALPYDGVRRYALQSRRQITRNGIALSELCFEFQSRAPVGDDRFLCAQTRIENARPSLVVNPLTALPYDGVRRYALQSRRQITSDDA
ncbi:ATP-binding cassette domain-containing protein [Mycobacterium tuberculosis]|uniref:ATP-binding cassette domain-containing protein n=1 Tax=Mycobacterium tuberculosis TaxID=1773 RepID=UPI002729F132|nr:ATP-binding cassette domain-containing protein [Mycobacterium tuberculosis]